MPPFHCLIVTGGSTSDYVYSPRGRLASLKQGGVEVASYLYDHAGHRVVRTLPGASTTVHYIYDKDGNVIAEHDGVTGAMLREYVWLDGTPLALVTGSTSAPQYNYVHNGQLGEPLLVTDASQSKLWEVVNDPWGNALPLATPTIAQDLRLPGQSLQVESGLFQNWHRDYDPTLGRYIEADPIGLAGGSNVFGYVEGNPVGLVDPEGLNPAAVRGAVIGGELAGDAFVWWCRSNIALCGRTIGPPVVRFSRACITAINSLTGNGGGKDPCKGLRDQLKDHERKLRDYQKNPMGSDNKGFLSAALAAGDITLYNKIRAGRVASLRSQIANFKKLLEECEKQNGR